MTSRPISGERFLVALGFLEISEKERQIIEDKLWKVCDVIKKWEDETVEKNKKKKRNANENGDKDEKNKSESGSGSGDKKEVERNKDEESEGGNLKIEIAAKKNNDNGGESDREVEIEVEDKGFGSYWPFQLSQIECDRATAYLCAINNSHIITQLISNLKILKLAEERGLQILDSNLISEIENVEIPLRDDDDDDGDNDDDDSDCNDDYDDDHNNNGDGYAYGSHDQRNMIGDINLPLTRSSQQSENGSESSSIRGHLSVLSEGENTEEEIKGEEKEKNRTDEKREVENSYSDEEDDDDEDDGDYYDVDDYVGYCQDIRLKGKRRKNRRRAACNKKRRMKKKIKYVEAESQETREEVEYERIVEVEGEGEGNMRRRVSFNMDSAHEGQVKVPDPAQPHPQMVSGEVCNIVTIDNSDNNDDDNNKVKLSTFKIDLYSSISTPSSSSSCLIIERQNTPLSLSLSEPSSEKLNGHSSPGPSPDHSAVHRTYIRDVVHTDERKKSIRVHEYYKLWRIYDLDVVY